MKKGEIILHSSLVWFFFLKSYIFPFLSLSLNVFVYWRKFQIPWLLLLWNHPCLLASAPGEEIRNSKCISHPTWNFYGLRYPWFPFAPHLSLFQNLFRSSNGRTILHPHSPVQKSLYLLHKPTDYTPILFPFPGHLFWHCFLVSMEQFPHPSRCT